MNRETPYPIASSTTTFQSGWYVTPYHTALLIATSQMGWYETFHIYVCHRLMLDSQSKDRLISCINECLAIDSGVNVM